MMVWLGNNPNRMPENQHKDSPMKTYANAAELITAIHTALDKYLAEFADIAEADKHHRAAPDGKTPGRTSDLPARLDRPVVAMGARRASRPNRSYARRRLQIERFGRAVPAVLRQPHAARGASPTARAGCPNLHMAGNAVRTGVI